MLVFEKRMKFVGEAAVFRSHYSIQGAQVRARQKENQFIENGETTMTHNFYIIENRGETYDRLLKTAKSG